MIGDEHSLTPGYVLRHVPPESNVGPDVAVIDIAQDFLLAHLHERGIFNHLVVFKGGTALRKLYAGTEGRFSTDIDLAAAEPDMDREEIADLIAEESDVTLGPFRFQPTKSRGRWRIAIMSPLGDPAVSMKLDVGPPCWLESEERDFVAAPTHRRYGFNLPALPSMTLEEILSEKIARLTRTATARDASDLVWAATTSPYSKFSPTRVRRISILKVWVDNHGLRPAWSSALAAKPFDPQSWLATREAWDDEQIGLLVHPPPTIRELEADLRHYYGWLRDLDHQERDWAAADVNDRGRVIDAIRNLEHSALVDAYLW